MNPDLKFIKQAPLTNGGLIPPSDGHAKSFLEHGAISPEQYRASADGLTQKMHLQPKE